MSRTPRVDSARRLRPAATRLILRAAGLIPVRRTSEIGGRPPVLVFDSLDDVPSVLLDSLVSTYRDVFAEPPWDESWTFAEVFEKLQDDLSDHRSRLTILEGDERRLVAGFAWGAVTPARRLPSRLADASGIDEGLIPNVTRRRCVFSVDELAIHRDFRAGFGHIQRLMCPLVSLAASEKVGMVFWTADSSRVLPVTKAAGFSEVARVESSRLLWSPPSVVKGVNRSVCVVPAARAAAALLRLAATGRRGRT